MAPVISSLQPVTVAVVSGIESNGGVFAHCSGSLLSVFCFPRPRPPSVCARLCVRVFVCVSKSRKRQAAGLSYCCSSPFNLYIVPVDCGIVASWQSERPLAVRSVPVRAGRYPYLLRLIETAFGSSVGYLCFCTCALVARANRELLLSIRR